MSRMVWRDIKETIEDVCSTIFSSGEDKEKESEKDSTKEEKTTEDNNPLHNLPDNTITR